MKRRNLTMWRYCASIGVLAVLASMQAAADGRISGRVGNQQAGVFFEGAIVRVEELNLETTSRRDGRFRFPRVSSGTYTVSVRYLGADRVTRTLTVGDANVVADFDVGADVPVLESVLVVGQAAGTSAALNKQRASDNLMTAVSSDAIGQFPDTNVGEALQRLPGVSVERDQGEGRYVRIRGLSAQYNSVSINGVRLPSPEAGSRAVALDTIPSDLLESLEVTKALRPDQDADSLGGAIEIKSLSAFDREDAYSSFSAEHSYDEHTEESSPKLAFSASDTFSVGDDTDNVGVATSLSWYDRDFGSDNVETGGDWDFDDGAASIGEFAQRDYTINRERLGAALNVDFRPGENDEYFVRTLYSRYQDDEQRQAVAVEFDADEDDEGNSIDAVTRELKDRIERQKVFSLAIGGGNQINGWRTDYQFGLSRAQQEEPKHISAGAFAAEFAEGLVGVNGARKPRIVAGDDFFAAQNYELDEIELSDTSALDVEKSFKLDLTRDLQFGANPGQLKFGGKVSRRDKSNDEAVWTVSGDGETLAQFNSGEVDYDFNRFGPGIDAGALNEFADAAEQEADAEKSVVEDYDIEEDINAAYAMARVDIGNLRVLGGVRYEATDFRAEGFSWNADDEVATSREHGKDYNHVLPSLHTRYKLGEDTIIRAAYSSSIARPAFEQARPGRLIDGDEIEFGNPDLDALEAQNLDFSIEHYTGRIGVISAGVFFKKIENFIYETNLAGSGEFVDADDAITFVNGDDAQVYGIELNYVQQLSMLPTPWNGLLVSANATFADSEATISRYDEGERIERDITLPSQSDTTANVAIGYENRWLSLRLAANYKSEYVSAVQEDLDVYDDAQAQIDFTARAYVTEQWQVYFKAMNLNDESYYRYLDKAGYNYQYEEYGPTYQLGVRFSNL